MSEPPDRADGSSATPTSSPLTTPGGAGDQRGASTPLHLPGGSPRAGIRAASFLLPAYFLTRFIETLLFGLIGPRLSPFAAFTVSRGLLSLVLLLLSALYLAALDNRKFRTLGLWFYRGWGREAIWGAAFGSFLMSIVVAVLLVARGIVYEGRAPGPGFAQSIPLIFSMFLVAGAMEELLFRGYGFQRMVEAVGAVGAVVLMSVLFGLLHMENPSATILSTVNTVLAGVLFSVAYLRTRALWLPIALHGAWNFFQGEIFSLPVSGLLIPHPLLNARMPGPPWFTGGPYGPEGGFVVTAVVLAGTVWLARTPRLAPSPAMQEALK